MIIGIGSDLIDIRRIEKALERHGDRFKQRCFTEIEREKAERKPAPAHVYAKRFAAKEACSKALGTGFKQGVFFKDMGVQNLPSGKPTMVLTGGAEARLAKIMPDNKTPAVHLTITDDYPWAQAFIVIEAI